MLPLLSVVTSSSLVKKSLTTDAEKRLAALALPSHLSPFIDSERAGTHSHTHTHTYALTRFREPGKEEERCTQVLSDGVAMQRNRFCFRIALSTLPRVPHAADTTT